VTVGIRRDRGRRYFGTPALPPKQLGPAQIRDQWGSPQYPGIGPYRTLPVSDWTIAIPSTCSKIAPDWSAFWRRNWRHGRPGADLQPFSLLRG